MCLSLVDLYGQFVSFPYSSVFVLSSRKRFSQTLDSSLVRIFSKSLNHQIKLLLVTTRTWHFMTSFGPMNYPIQLLSSVCAKIIFK